MKFFVTARDTLGSVTLHRESVPAALKKADELLAGGYFNVQVVMPDGAAYQPGEFDQLRERAGLSSSA
jgi:hypothetical protein